MNHSSDQVVRREKCSLIRNAINGAARTMAGPDLFMFAFTDYVHLLVNEPCALTFWKKSRGTYEPIFSSFRDPAIVDPNGLATGSHLNPKLVEHGVAFRDFKATVHIAGPKGFRFCPENTSLVGEIFNLDDTSEDGSTTISAEFVDLLYASLRNGPKPPAKSEINDAIDLSNDELLEESRKRIAAALDRVYGQFRESQFLHARGHSSEPFNLFAAFRYVESRTYRYKGIFPYTASLIFAESQPAELRDWCKRRNGDRQESEELARLMDGDWVRLLQSPLGPNSRAVFDSVVSGGFIDRGVKGPIGEAGAGVVWRSIAADPRDKARERAEELIYKGIVEDGGASAISYVPVHVSGVPWMALYTFCSVDKTSSAGMKTWLHNYNLYRDTFPRANDALRRELEVEYSQMVAARLGDALTLPKHRLIEAINRDSAKLSQIFPYDRLMFSDSRTSSDGTAIELPSGDSLRLCVQSNHFHPQQVDHKPLTIDAVVGECQKVIHARRQVEATSRNMVHTLKTYLEGISDGIDHMTRSLPDDDVVKLRQSLGRAVRLTDAVNCCVKGVSPELTTAPDVTIQEQIVALCEETFPKARPRLRFFTVVANSTIQTCRAFADAIAIELVRNGVEHSPPDKLIEIRFECDAAFVRIAVRTHFLAARLDRLQSLQQKQALAKHLVVAMDEISYFQTALNLPRWEVTHLDENAQTVEFAAAFGHVKD